MKFIMFEKGNNMIKELPWNVQKTGFGTGDMINQCYAGIWSNKIGERITTELYLEDAEYIISVCNAFPEVIEALRMVLHDSMTYDLKDTAEIIMSRAYSIMHKHNIKYPIFIIK